MQWNSLLQDVGVVENLSRKNWTNSQKLAKNDYIMSDHGSPSSADLSCEAEHHSGLVRRDLYDRICVQNMRGRSISVLSTKMG